MTPIFTLVLENNSLRLQWNEEGYFAVTAKGLLPEVVQGLREEADMLERTLQQGTEAYAICSSPQRATVN